MDTAWLIRDAQGRLWEAGTTRQDARAYARLWNRDSPKEAPHRVIPAKTCQACGGMGFHGIQNTWEQPCSACGGRGLIPAEPRRSAT